MQHFNKEKIKVFSVFILNFIIYVYIKKIGKNPSESKILEYVMYFLLFFSWYLYIFIKSIFTKYAIFVFFIVLLIINICFYYFRVN